MAPTNKCKKDEQAMHSWNKWTVKEALLIYYIHQYLIMKFLIEHYQSTCPIFFGSNYNSLIQIKSPPKLNQNNLSILTSPKSKLQTSKRSELHFTYYLQWKSIKKNYTLFSNSTNFFKCQYIITWASRTLHLTSNLNYVLEKLLIPTSAHNWSVK